MDKICAVRVTANAPADLSIEWDESYARGPVDVFAGPAPDRIDLQRAVATGAIGAAVLPGAPARQYFRLTPRDGEALTVAQRNVPLEGSINFRDLGGYRTNDARRVRWGRVFRSGHMAKLTAAGKAGFAALDVRAICDFRLAEERETENAELPGTPPITTIGIPPGIGDRHFFHRVFAATDDPAVVREAVHDTMRAVIRDSADRFARMFDVLLGTAEGSVLLNCSAGKERTGIGSALFLTALGVPRETVFMDFMLSRQYFPAASEVARVREKYAVRATDDAAAAALIMPLLETHESYLAAAFAAIADYYGDTSSFLTQACGLGTAELEQLRALYTA